ncbi:Dynein light chain 4, axonemal [Phlyctochytrium planicorne]|nr:Dynein light chain 4, axonemal [Phlyctochytrium planicorne]
MADLSGSSSNLAADKPAAATGAAGDKAEEKDLRKNFNYPLVKVWKHEGPSFSQYGFSQTLLTLSSLLFQRPPKQNKVCDMVDELRVEAVDMIVTAVEKHPGNYEAAAKTIKELMDKRCGSSWHVVVGEGFGFEVTHEMRNLMFMYFGGNIGILVFKAS